MWLVVSSTLLLCPSACLPPLPLPFSPPCIPAELRLRPLGLLFPLLPSLLESPGAVGPAFLPGSLRPISVFMLEPWSPRLSLPHPHHREWTVERWRLVRAAREPDLASEFLPPCPNKSRVVYGSPWVPAPLPTQPLLWLTGPNLSCLHAASPPSLGSPDADTF